MGLSDTEAAWLSGFWDGEGSIGLTRCSPVVYNLSAQLSHTDRASVVEILRLLAAAGINGRGYTYQERDPSKHRDAHHLRVTGMMNVDALAALLLPFAITKRAHWVLAREWVARRVRLAGGLDAKGHLLRGGIPGVAGPRAGRAYTEEDQQVLAAFRALNSKGPAERAARLRGPVA